MSIIHFPKLSNTIWKQINCVIDSESPIIYISFSLFHFLSEINRKKYEVKNVWEDNFKITNEYENILNIDCQTNISIYKPISDMYFKMTEIMQSIRINFKDFKSQGLTMVSFGDNPCEFIEPFYNFRKNQNDIYHGFKLSLSKDDEKTQQFTNNNNINILSLENQKSIETLFFLCDKYKNSIDLIVCEGDPENENEFIKNELLFIQISNAIGIQAKGGCLIIKLADCFHKTTIDIIFILSSMYDKIQLIKPSISQQISSERFLICSNFLFSDYKEYIGIFEKTIKKIIEKDKNEIISCFLSHSQIPIFFKNKVDEYNAIIGQIQLEGIYNTFSLIENKNKIDYYIKNNSKKCALWCDKYKVEYLQNIEVNDKMNIFRQ
jgi:hypothetical protein